MHNQTVYDELRQLNLKDHGDARERAIWPFVSDVLSNYEKFWQTFVVLLTNRVDATRQFGTSDWIRLRQGLPRHYEDLAMSNYSSLYHAACAREYIRDNHARITSGLFYRPEIVFFYLESCIENAKRLHATAVRLLRRLKMEIRLPKHPEALYQKIGRYRNAFTHDPVLGRSANHGRELIPHFARLPQVLDKNAFLRWSETETIPAAEMVDGLKCQEDLWTQLAVFLQEMWGGLTQTFFAARVEEQLMEDIRLSALLPFPALNLGSLSTASPFAASGTMFVVLA